MKVFEVRPLGGYCGGCVLVNAHDEGEAWDVARREDCFCELDDRARFSIDEILGLTYSADEPCVILSALYFE